MTTEKPEVLLHALLVGRAPSEAEAEAFVHRSRGCPYAASYTATGRTVVGLFVLPAEKRWWLEIADQPELLGLEALEIYFPAVVATSSPWSRGETQPVMETAPCGTDCLHCPQYRGRCRGCPATRHLA